MKVLILDDQPEVFDSIKSTLLAAKFRAHYAASIEDAAKLVESQSFDLAFVDLQMPPGNWGGLEAIMPLAVTMRSPGRSPACSATLLGPTLSTITEELR